MTRPHSHRTAHPPLHTAQPSTQLLRPVSTTQFWQGEKNTRAQYVPCFITLFTVSCVNTWVREVFRKTAVGGDWLSSSHLHSQVKSRHKMRVFMPLVVLWIGQFCCDVIGHQNLRFSDWLVVVLLLLLICLLFCWGLSVYESSVGCR